MRILAVLSLVGMFLLLAHANSAEPCRTVNVDTVPPVTVTTMQHNGWTSDPTDGAEQLYSPSCNR